MATAAPLVLADGVPVNRTYQPLQVSSSDSIFVDKTTYTTLGQQSTVQILWKGYTEKRATDRVEANMALPKVVTTGTETKVTSIGRVMITYIIPIDFNDVDRGNLAALGKALAADSVVLGLVRDRNTIY